MSKILVCSILWMIMSSACLGQASGDRAANRQAVEACLSQCSSSDSSCRRVCPITFSGPCLSSCDARAQTCRQSCQKR